MEGLDNKTGGNCLGTYSKIKVDQQFPFESVTIGKSSSLFPSCYLLDQLDASQCYINVSRNFSTSYNSFGSSLF